MSCGTLVPASRLIFSRTGLLPTLAELSSSLLLKSRVLDDWPTTPKSKLFGLASFPFARRYLGNHYCFLFLRVLRCFSSPRALRYTMDSCNGDRLLTCRVSPFRNLRIVACLRLPVAYRSLPRLSSAYGAMASTLCSY